MDKQYTGWLERFERAVSVIQWLSQGTAGIPSPSSKHYWASILYTRLTGSSISLLLLLPGNSLSKQASEHWDFSAIASLTRNICECCFTYFYLCADTIGEEEWYCRWNIFNLHDCLRRLMLFQLIDGSVEEINEFEKTADEIRNRLESNSHFKSLPMSIQKNCLKGEKPYLLTQNEILEKMGIDEKLFRALYIIWSSHIHTLPLSFYRMRVDNRGRGIENPTDTGYICQAIEISIDLTRSISKAHLDLFPEADLSISELELHVLFDLKPFDA